MKKKYAKPLVTVITLIADQDMASASDRLVTSANDIVIGEDELEDLLG